MGDPNAFQGRGRENWGFGSCNQPCVCGRSRDGFGWRKYSNHLDDCQGWGCQDKPQGISEPSIWGCSVDEKTTRSQKGRQYWTKGTAKRDEDRYPKGIQ